MPTYLEKLEFSVERLSEALHLPQEDILEYFRDGRRVSFVCERRVAYEYLQGTLAPSEGAAFDVLDSQGKKWEIRSLGKGGVYFCPSYMVGSGRSFNEEGFLRKLDEIEGYIVCGIMEFPSVPIWKIRADAVRSAWESGRLGKTTKISPEKFRRIFSMAFEQVQEEGRLG
ncbi:hypothetical protein D6833_04325 [Candidatus Parcubacteria bacterium]|nr:MAG: hypothetical protein D6833_04325 [Candidatus Parcubacteria bacterium]